MHVPVLIVGGGPVGLSASVLLSRFGIPSLLVERRASTTVHPKARSINVRTLEIYRQWGLEDRLREASLPPEWSRQIVYTTTLSGPEIGRMRSDSMGLQPGGLPSPTGYLLSSQDRIEPILRECAESYVDADVRYGIAMTRFDEDGSGVSAILRDETGDEQTIRADYLLAADGAASPVREALGIGMEGPQGLAHVINTYFRADLHPWIADRPAGLYWVAAPGVAGVLQPIDHHDRWLCQIGYNPERETPDDFPPERCADWVRRAVGDDNVAVEILSTIPWSMNAAVAERFRAGRVFLMGDAAHQLPPTGGFGMNTGVQDAHNLVWKLAAVLQGWAGEPLLGSYEVERVPIARYNTQRSLENFGLVQRVSRAALLPGEERTNAREADAAVRDSRRYGNWLGMDLGLAYESGALVPDGTDPPDVSDPVMEYVPTGRPGHRAPHGVVEREGSPISTLDLFEREMVLLAGADGKPWVDAARGVSRVPLSAYRLAADGELVDRDGACAATYGIAPEGAVLVRPDGHVGWRSRTASADPGAEIREALGTLLSVSN